MTTFVGGITFCPLTPLSKTKGKPMTTDTAIEQEIQAKGLTAPRVTMADIEASIA
jgi:hypothetical protein